MSVLWKKSEKKKKEARGRKERPAGPLLQNLYRHPPSLQSLHPQPYSGHECEVVMNTKWLLPTCYRQLLSTQPVFQGVLPASVTTATPVRCGEQTHWFIAVGTGQGAAAVMVRRRWSTVSGLGFTLCAFSSVSASQSPQTVKVGLFQYQKSEFLLENRAIVQGLVCMHENTHTISFGEKMSITYPQPHWE